MRRYVVPTIVLAAVGFSVGVLYRFFVNPADQATLANYLRSGFHGAGLALAGWATHLYFTSRSSAWLTRWPLAAELGVRSLAMALVVATVASALQVVLYDQPIQANWLTTDFPRIIAVAFVMSIVVAGAYELTRLIGGRVLFNVMIGRYRRPIREERILLFLDLAGSTTLAEKMGEVRVQDLLTRFFYDIDEAITAHGGEVHAYVGDEVIVTWPVTGGRRDRRCLDCFFAIRDRIAELAGQISARIRPNAGFSRRPACRSDCHQRMRQFAPAGRLFRRHRECDRAAAGPVQGIGALSARLRRPVAPDRPQSGR